MIAAGAIRAAYDPSVLGDSFGPIALFDVGAAIASAALVVVFVASAVRNTRSCIPPSVVRGALATARLHDARCPCSGRDAQHVRAAARRSIELTPSTITEWNRTSGERPLTCTNAEAPAATGRPTAGRLIRRRNNSPLARLNGRSPRYRRPGRQRSHESGYTPSRRRP